MTTSQKLTVVDTAGVITVNKADATIGDIFTTAISTTEAVTGIYGLAQRAGLLVGGMAIQEFRRTGKINPFGA
jgi:hypothetical protein